MDGQEPDGNGSVDGSQENGGTSVAAEVEARKQLETEAQTEARKTPEPAVAMDAETRNRLATKAQTKARKTPELAVAVEAETRNRLETEAQTEARKTPEPAVTVEAETRNRPATKAQTKARKTAERAVPAAPSNQLKIPIAQAISVEIASPETAQAKLRIGRMRNPAPEKMTPVQMTPREPEMLIHPAAKPPMTATARRLAHSMAARPAAVMKFSAASGGYEI